MQPDTGMQTLFSLLLLRVSHTEQQTENCLFTAAILKPGGIGCNAQELGCFQFSASTSRQNWALETGTRQTSRTSADAVPCPASHRDGKSQKSRRSLSARPARATSAGSKRSNLERNKGGMFAANVPKNPYMKTSFRIKRIKALETGTWLRQSNIQTGAQYT